RLALEVDVLWLAQAGASERGLRDGVRVERPVVRWQLDELERPEQRSERLSVPDELDDVRLLRAVVGMGEPGPELGLQRAAALHHLPLRTQLRARHPVNLDDERPVERTFRSRHDCRRAAPLRSRTWRRWRPSGTCAPSAAPLRA